MTYVALAYVQRGFNGAASVVPTMHAAALVQAVGIELVLIGH
jgi:hypothetical protein